MLPTVHSLVIVHGHAPQQVRGNARISHMSAAFSLEIASLTSVRFGGSSLMGGSGTGTATSLASALNVGGGVYLIQLLKILQHS